MATNTYFVEGNIQPCDAPQEIGKQEVINTRSTTWQNGGLSLDNLSDFWAAFRGSFAKRACGLRGGGAGQCGEHTWSRFRTFDKKHGRTAERHQRRHRRERARSCRVESTKDGTLLCYVGTRRICPSAPKLLSNCNIEPRLWKIIPSAELGSSRFRERHAVLAFVRRRRYLSCNGASPIIFQVWSAAAPCSAA
jgi:hypothetical protein